MAEPDQYFKPVTNGAALPPDERVPARFRDQFTTAPGRDRPDPMAEFDARLAATAARYGADRRRRAVYTARAIVGAGAAMLVSAVAMITAALWGVDIGRGCTFAAAGVAAVAWGLLMVDVPEAVSDDVERAARAARDERRG